MDQLKNLKSKQKWLLRLVLLLLPVSFAFSVLAQDEEATGSSLNPENIYFSKGLLQDVNLPRAPKGAKPMGNYQKHLRLEWDAEKRVMRVNPTSEGDGTLNIVDPATNKIVYRFAYKVQKSDRYAIAKEIRALLSDVDGITVRIVNNRVLVDGQILLPRDLNRIHSVVKQYAGLAGSLVTLSPMAQTKIAELIERDINNPEIHVRAVNGKFFLEGVAGDQTEKDKAEIIAKVYVPDVIVDEAYMDKKLLKTKVDVVINLITIRATPPAEPDKMISVAVHYVELQKNYSKGFRFQWMPDIGDGSQIQFQNGGGNGQSGIASTITGTLTNLLPKLNWAKQHGFARVLQTSTIIVQDNREGVLNNITRLPYQVVNDHGAASTNFEEAGLRTSLTPEILGARSDSIKLNLKFAIKSLISYTAQGPTTSSSEIQTVVTIRSGQSAAIGGLISSDSGTNYNKLPPNVSANPLISLYASKDFRKNRSQFVVFVTPSIKSSASAGTEQIKRKFRLKD